MRKVVYILALTSILFITGCGNKEEIKTELNDFRDFVTHLENDTDKWAAEPDYWLPVEKKYDTLRTNLNNAEYSSQNDKDELNNLVNKYEKVRLRYYLWRNENGIEKFKANRKSELYNEFISESIDPIDSFTSSQLISATEKMGSQLKKFESVLTKEDINTLNYWNEKLIMRRIELERNRKISDTTAKKIGTLQSEISAKLKALNPA